MYTLFFVVFVARIIMTFVADRALTTNHQPTIASVGKCCWIFVFATAVPQWFRGKVQNGVQLTHN